MKVKGLSLACIFHVYIWKLLYIPTYSSVKSLFSSKLRY